MGLVNLNIKNYALIDRLQVEFDPGFLILTGETGAGKSIIVGALSFVLGERGSADLVRSGEEKAYIEAQFDISGDKRLIKVLKETGLEPEEILTVSREILSSGKTQARLNGRAVTQTILRQISRLLIDIHGQHEHQSLLDVESHLDLLDGLGGEEVARLRESVFSLWSQLEGLTEQFRKLTQSKEERQKQIDFLKFQIKEVSEANLVKGEDTDLEKEKNVLANAEKLAELSSLALKALSNDDIEGHAAVDQLKQVEKVVQDIAEIDKKAKGLYEEVVETATHADELARELRDYREKMEFNPARLAEVGDRLDLINQLKRKYGESIAAVLKSADEKKKELEDLETSEERTEGLEKEIKKLSAALAAEAKTLSAKRKVLVKEVEKKVKEELKALNMARTNFKVEIKALEGSGAKGIDAVEFLISPNPGEPLKPLAKIASGGEISRVMLALKSMLIQADKVPTMVFDEIDVGIGGKTAVAVGEKLYHLSSVHQVVCITHLPQIASFADENYHVSKAATNGRTKVMVKKLSKSERVEELARLLSGKVTEATRKNAQEMLAEAQVVKGSKSRKAKNYQLTEGLGL